jgi:hypothetical protein
MGRFGLFVGLNEGSVASIDGEGVSSVGSIDGGGVGISSMGSVPVGASESGIGVGADVVLGNELGFNDGLPVAVDVSVSTGDSDLLGAVGAGVEVLTGHVGFCGPFAGLYVGCPSSDDGGKDGMSSMGSVRVGLAELGRREDGRLVGGEGREFGFEVPLLVGLSVTVVGMLFGMSVGASDGSFVDWYVGSFDGVFSISSTRLGALELGVFGTGVGSACGHP